MFDIMTRLKVRNMAEGGSSQADISQVTGVPIQTVHRIVSEPAPTREDVIAGARAGAERLGRPRKADDAMVERVGFLLADPKNADISAIQVLRRARTWGFRGGRGQMAALVNELRPVRRQEPVVRFDGLPGEYSQFDFGECEVEFVATGKVRIQFFGGRLKFSRLMHVVRVPDQCAETLVRSVIACLAVFGGSTKEWVFDNPKTVRISRLGLKPVILRRYLAQLVTEHNVIATLCADMEAQLAEWPHEVNVLRPRDATGEIPAVAQQQEAARLAGRPRPVRTRRGRSLRESISRFCRGPVVDGHQRHHHPPTGTP